MRTEMPVEPNTSMSSLPPEVVNTTTSIKTTPIEEKITTIRTAVPA